MHLQFDPERGTAYLALDPAATSCHQLALTADYDPHAAGITLDFDEEACLIGVGFEDARRQLAGAILRGDRPVIELDPAEKYGEPGVGQAYLDLDPERTARTDQTVVIDVEEVRTAGDVNLDIDRNGRVLGIEFVDARDVPAILLKEARRI
jgi:uncharacterized protein YuzE